jgi:hypothetical protein
MKRGREKIFALLLAFSLLAGVLAGCVRTEELRRTSGLDQTSAPSVNQVGNVVWGESAVADFDGDRRSDKATTRRDAHGYEIEIQLSGRRTSVILESPPQVQVEEPGFFICDLDADHLQDVVVPDFASAAFQVWLNDGKGNFRPVSSVTWMGQSKPGKRSPGAVFSRASLPAVVSHTLKSPPTELTSKCAPSYCAPNDAAGVEDFSAFILSQLIRAQKTPRSLPVVFRQTL